MATRVDNARLERATALLAQDAETPAGLSAPMVAARYEEKFGRMQLLEIIRDALHPDKAKPGRAHQAFVRHRLHNQKTGLTFRNGLIIMGSGAVEHVLREFVSRKWTSHVPAFAKGKP